MWTSDQVLLNLLISRKKPAYLVIFRSVLPQLLWIPENQLCESLLNSALTGVTMVD